MGEKNRLKAERARFLTEEVRRAEPETELLLTRWVKSGVFFESKSRSKRFFHPLPSAYTQKRFMREWREKSDWSKDIPEYYLIIYPHKMDENLLKYSSHSHWTL